MFINPLTRRLMPRPHRTARITCKNLAIRRRRLAAEALEPRFLLSTFGVVNTDDSGLGSFRQALLDANASPGPDSIEFQIPSALADADGVFVIQPQSQLPAISGETIIDGRSQPSTNRFGPAIALVGSDAGSSADGLQIRADDSQVLALNIQGFDGDGIDILNASGVLVAGNYIGTDAQGFRSAGNDNGVRIRGGTGNTIGGISEMDPNVIAANADDGVEIDGSSGNLIQGNYIGTNSFREGDLGNADDGIDIDASWNNTIRANVILFNEDDGILIDDSWNNTIQANEISQHADDGVQIRGETSSSNVLSGNRIVANDDNGVKIYSPQNTIGGTNEEDRNIISNNGDDGVDIDGSSATGNVILGNFIGLGDTGTFELGNGDNGIEIDRGLFNTIGGTTAAARNVISSNGNNGVEFRSNASDNSVIGNYIGTDVTGMQALGNGIYGVFMDDAERNRIGGESPGEGNTIAFNGLDGVLVQRGTGNAILRNSIFENGELGIDLLDQGGVTPNDFGDGDTGGNNLQNFPVLTSFERAGSTTIVAGSLNSSPHTSFRVEFFSIGDVDPSNHGEGDRYLDHSEITTDDQGNAVFQVQLDAQVEPGHLITATATNLTTFDTSEFSRFGSDVDLGLIQGFEGISDTGGAPPDPIIAAGPDQLVAMVNARIAIYDKDTGATLFEQNTFGPDGFWAPVGATFGSTDPWVRYDPNSGRFFAVVLEIRGDLDQAFIYLAVSTDATPTNGDDWHKYQINRTGTHSRTGVPTFPDFPKLGVDGDAIYVTGNDFGILRDGFSHVSLFAVEKAPLLVGNPVNILYDEAITGVSALHPVVVHEPAPAMYLPEATFFGGNTVRIHAITDILGSPIRTTSHVPVPSYGFPPDVPQKGGGAPLDTFDAIVMSGVVRDGSLWTAHAIQDPAVDSETVARWYQFDVTQFPGGSATLVQSGNVDPGVEIHTWFPHVSVDQDGDMGIVFSRSGPNEFASIGYTGRLASDPLNTTRLVEVARAGEGNYQLPPGGRNRWGDYGGLAIDPDGETFWLFHEYPTASNTWGTYVGAFRVDSVIHPSAAPANATPLLQQIEEALDKAETAPFQELQLPEARAIASYQQAEASTFSGAIRESFADDSRTVVALLKSSATDNAVSKATAQAEIVDRALDELLEDLLVNTEDLLLS